MTTQRLDKQSWQEFFDRTAKDAVAKQASVEVASIELGDQIQVSSLPLLGITYDPKSQIIEIAMDGVDHLIRKPSEIIVDLEGNSLAAVKISDADGNDHIVKLKEPLALPKSTR